MYGYAKENNQLRFAPRVFKSWPGYEKKSHAERVWKFFALTQVCKQIRAEYRPLWINDCSIRLNSTYSLRSFVDDFLHQTDTVKHAPKLFQYAWEHDDDSKRRVDLTVLLQLRAHCPHFQVEFVPYKVATGDQVHDDICPPCLTRSFNEEHGLDFLSDDGQCFCPEFDMDQEEWEYHKVDQMSYTSDIEQFIHNDNEAWIHAVKEGEVSVSCTFSQTTDRITFKILYKEPVCSTTANSNPAKDLLKRWGLIGPPGCPYGGWFTDGMDFVVAYEDKQTTREDGYEMVNSVVREVHINREPFNGTFEE